MAAFDNDFVGAFMLGRVDDVVGGVLADQVVERALNIAGDICVYTNREITVETVK